MSIRTFNQSDILGFENRYRAKFINSLSGYKPLNLIGTKSDKGQENLAIFSSVFHLGADPALFGMVTRPDVSPRHTLANIERTKCYTINHVALDFYANAHQTSARYDEAESEFLLAKLDPFYSEKHFAPYVLNSPIKIGMSLIDIMDVKHNGTKIIIGKIEEVILDPKLISDDGFIDLNKADILCGGGLDCYYKTSSLGRLSYAKPNSWPSKVDA